MPASPSPGLPVPPPNLWRSEHRDLESWIDSAHFAIDLLASLKGRSDLGGLEVLDVGCGTKVSRTLIEEQRPIGRYVGVDVSRKTVDWLRSHVDDPRFEYHHLDARNALYNPSGTPLHLIDGLLPTVGAFDLISLFSVFTHIEPDDYVVMLRLLRPLVKPDGRLVFSVFIDEDANPAIERALEADLSSDDPERVERANAAIARAIAAGPAPRFVDARPDKPLMEARYRRSYAVELVAGTGWEILDLHDPVPPYIQHYLVCAPA